MEHLKLFGAIVMLFSSVNILTGSRATTAWTSTTQDKWHLSGWWLFWVAVVRVAAVLMLFQHQFNMVKKIVVSLVRNC